MITVYTMYQSFSVCMQEHTGTVTMFSGFKPVFE